jgi:hypothetical protein
MYVCICITKLYIYICIRTHLLDPNSKCTYDAAMTHPVACIGSVPGAGSQQLEEQHDIYQSHQYKRAPQQYHSERGHKGKGQQ